MLHKIWVIPFCLKKVHDCITAIIKNEVNYLLKAFNDNNSKLKFTYEMKENHCLHYSDVTLIRNTTNIIETKWYTNSTWSSRYQMVSYNSYHPKTLY